MFVYVSQIDFLISVLFFEQSLLDFTQVRSWLSDIFV